MSSESDSSCTLESESSSDVNSETYDSEEEMAVVHSRFEPYQDEPLAVDDEGNNNGDVEYDAADPDGLTPEIIAARFRREVSVENWCECGNCCVDHLVGALEFRCCREIGEALGKLTFDGSIERITCVTEHEDYLAHSNNSVLIDVAPLLRDRNGRTYRRRAGQTENEFLRAVAYRWIIRWMCGYIGWDKTRPLPACVYNHIRTKFETRGQTGFAFALARQ